jgi:spore maturation protein B
VSEIIAPLSNLIFLSFLVGVPVYGHFRGVKVYESFVKGAKEGFETAVAIIPFLTAVMVAVGMLRASGATKLLTSMLPDALVSVGFAPEVAVMALMRPLSGAASLGALGEIITAYGPDSLQARLGGVISGSTETTLYVLAVYFGAVSITKTRYALHCGLFADAAGVIASTAICALLFR